MLKHHERVYMTHTGTVILETNTQAEGRAVISRHRINNSVDTPENVRRRVPCSEHGKRRSYSIIAGVSLIQCLWCLEVHHKACCYSLPFLPMYCLVRVHNSESVFHYNATAYNENFGTTKHFKFNNDACFVDKHGTVRIYYTMQGTSPCTYVRDCRRNLRQKEGDITVESGFRL